MHLVKHELPILAERCGAEFLPIDVGHALANGGKNIDFYCISGLFAVASLYA